jgi:hypothetical protein
MMGFQKLFVVMQADDGLETTIPRRIFRSARNAQRFIDELPEIDRTALWFVEIEFDDAD